MNAKKPLPAPVFQLVTMPCKSLPMIASSEDSTMAASRATAASACLRSVMSARMATYWYGLPSALRKGTIVVSTQ